MEHTLLFELWCHVQSVSERQQVTERCLAPTCVMFSLFAILWFCFDKIISVFLESTNIRRVKPLVTVNLRFYARLFHV